ncbi:MAG TPA: hypothetical protein VFS24_15795 [Steroidobacteraceae bacterium]|nr:hypothetical protein [Steroidobacteraceae bacterium]
MRMKAIQEQFRLRDLAMKRARMCKEFGFGGIHLDVRIARMSNRIAIRLINGAPL